MMVKEWVRGWLRHGLDFILQGLLWPGDGEQEVI